MLYSKSGIGWRAAFFPMLSVPNLGAFVPAHAPSRMGRLEDIPALDAFPFCLFPGARRVPPVDLSDMPFPGALCAATDLVGVFGGENLPALDAFPFCLFPGVWGAFGSGQLDLPVPGAPRAARYPPRS